MVSCGVMSKSEKSGGVKSAYELALERMESQGIERPRENALSDADREEVADIRNRAEAKIAELEILFRKTSQDPEAPPETRMLAEREFQADRKRIEEGRDAKIRKLRERPR